jgi:hypothetical protein
LNPAKIISDAFSGLHNDDRPSRGIPWVSLLLIGALLSIFSLSYSQYEDMGFFLSLAATISQGHSLYTGFFDIKDPLFMAIVSLAYWAFGPVGPYLVDAIAVLFAPLVGYMSARKFGLGHVYSFGAAILFAGSLAGDYFQSLRTTAVALVLLLSSIYLLKSTRYALTGVVLAIVLGYKFAYLPIVAAVILLVFAISYLEKRWEILGKLFLALGFTFTFILLALHLRGEFPGYLEMMTMNFEYRGSGPAIMGQDGSLPGRFESIFRFGSNPVVLAFASLLPLGIALLERKRVPQLVFPIVQLAILSSSVFGFIFLSVMWVHHLQVTSLIMWSGYVSLVLLIQELHSSRPWVVGVSVVLIFSAMSSTGFSLKLTPKTDLPNLVNPSWIIPPEASYIQNRGWPSTEIRYAKLGPNDELGLAAFLPENWSLGCPYYAQVGTESVEIVSKISHCIVNDVDAVILTPGFFSLERDLGTYSSLKEMVRKNLIDHYICEPVIERPGSEICIRK